MKVSYWEESSFYRPVDALIVGSGIVGLQAAIHLKKKRKDWDILICERGSIPSGASTRNAGFGCLGSPSELLADLEEHGEQQVWDLVAARHEGLEKLCEQFDKEDMEWEQHGGYELFTSENSQSLHDVQEAIPSLNEQMNKITGNPNYFQISDSPHPFSNGQKLINIPSEAQLHPGKLMLSLVEQAQHLGIRFLSQWKIEHIETDPDHIRVYSDADMPLTTKHLLLATNGFTHQLFPQLPVFPARNQVLLTSPIPDLPIKGCFHFDRGYIYFRNVGNRVLIGGARNRAPEEEQTDEAGTTEEITNALKEMVHEVILPNKNVRYTHEWSGILGLGESKFPILEEITPNVFAAVRLGGMGVALGSWLGEKAADLVLKE